VVESQPSKLLVAGSIPVSRSIRLRALGQQARYGAMPRPSAMGAKAGSLRPPPLRGRGLRLASQPPLRTGRRQVYPPKLVIDVMSEGGPM
jgi:hypothetical protein